MKPNNPLHYADPPTLAVLTGLAIGFALLIHRVFILVALAFALVWPLKRLFEIVAESVPHHRHI
ncbi:MAG: hypothetical protein ACXWAX_08720 [Chthoniobacterales bacterium]